MYSLYVYDKTLTRIGIVESIESLQWLAEYQDAGEVKLVCGATPKNIDLLRDGFRLCCTDQPESAIIRETTINDTAGGAKITVRAILSAARWDSRVVMATENIVNVEDGMLSLTKKNRRELPGITAQKKGLSVKTSTQITWGNVLEAEKTLAEASGLGFREVFDPYTGQETFEVYQGTDRTSGDSYNGYFGDDIENLLDIHILSGTADWKNVAIVGGQGEGADRKVVTVSLGRYEGDARRELWVDARDLSQTYQEATPTGEHDTNGNPIYTYTTKSYTDNEYEEMLKSRGIEKLAQCLQTLEIDASIGRGIMSYGKDYFLGDIVPLKITKYGLRISARIAAVKTVYECTGKKVSAVLSDFNIKKEGFTL